MPDATPTAAPPDVSARLEAPRAAAIAGIAFAVLFVVSLTALHRHPRVGSGTETLAAWYLGDGARRIALVGVYLVPFAGIAFLWFLAALRHNLATAGDRFFDTALLGSGLLFVAMLWGAAAAIGAPVTSVTFRDAPAPVPETVEGARSLGYTLFYVYALRAAAVFMVVSCTVARRRGRLPRWLVALGYVAAVMLLLSIAFAPLVALVFPTWVALASMVVLSRSRSRTIDS